MEISETKDIVGSNENMLLQLVHMAMSDEKEVVVQICKIMGMLVVP